MRIKFQQSGGLPGVTKVADLDAEQLAAADRQELEAVVRQSGLQESWGAYSPRAKDLTQYEIIIEADGGVRRAAFDDLTTPDELRPLLKYLQARAKPRPAKAR